MSLAQLTAPGPTRAADRRLGVPWTVVVPLAAVLSAVDGYWVASMRSAVGAIERTTEPFLTWAHQTLVTLPLHVLAVVAALALSLRWLGPAPRGRRQLWTGLLVALSTAAVGALLLALGALVDHRLQQGHVDLMSHMTPGCGAPCLERIEADGVATAVRSVLWGAGLVVVSNLAVVAWAMAALGGRLPATRRPRRVSPLPRRGGRELVLAAALAGSAVIHLAVVPEHVGEWPLAGAFFVALAGVEVLAAVLVLLVARTAAALPEAYGGTRDTEASGQPGSAGRGRALLVLASTVVVGALPLVVWLVSRTVGLPFGPEPGEVEAIGEADLAAVVLELVSVGLAAALLLAQPVRAPGARRGTDARHRRAVALVAVLAVTVIGFTGALPDLLGDVTGPATEATTSLSGQGHGHDDGDSGVSEEDAGVDQGATGAEQGGAGVDAAGESGSVDRGGAATPGTGSGGLNPPRE